MLGHRDVEDTEGKTPADLASLLKERLVHLAKITGVRVIFGGLVTVGSVAKQAMIVTTLDLLFQSCSELRGAGVTFLDLASPSRFAVSSNCYTFEGQLTDSFKAISLFSLSRLVAMTTDHLLVPTELYRASSSDRQFLEVVSKKRARIG